MKLDTDNLEKALSKKESEIKKPENNQQAPEMTKDQEIAFHQGALNTLMNERNELIKIIKNVEVVIQAHLGRLEELGIKIQKQN
jgi:hypothetical protein